MAIYDVEARSLEGEPVALARYRGKVTLIVNLASKCGFTPQYAGLERLHETYEPRGFCVLGFPCNDFGGQEPGSAEEIREFCTSRYAVTFPLFEKVQVKPGPNQSALYAALQRATNLLPSWNFGKYLVGGDGEVIRYFPSKVAPDDTVLVSSIESALNARS